MRRILLPRSDIVKVCEMNKTLVRQYCNSCVYLANNFTYTGIDKGIKPYRLFQVKSKKTGNVSREVSAFPIEIEGVSPLFCMFWTDTQFRKSEILVDASTYKEYRFIPIARHKTFGYMVYSIEEIA